MRKKFCTRCGTKTVEGEKYCANCGEQIEFPDEVPQMPAQPAHPQKNTQSAHSNRQKKKDEPSISKVVATDENVSSLLASLTKPSSSANNSSENKPNKAKGREEVIDDAMKDLMYAGTHSGSSLLHPSKPKLSENNASIADELEIEHQQAQTDRDTNQEPEQAPVSDQVKEEPSTYSQDQHDSAIISENTIPDTDDPIDITSDKEILESLKKETDNDVIDDKKEKPTRTRTRPQKQPKQKPTIRSPFLLQDPIEDDFSEPTIVEDNIYNESMRNQYEKEIKEELMVEDRKKKVRSVNTASNQIGSKAKSATNKALDKATDIAAKKLISEDRHLKSRHRVYIVEQEKVIDPDDPSYDGYYENIIPVDEVDDLGSEKTRKRFAFNKETKQTILILIALIIALFVIIFTQF